MSVQSPRDLVPQFFDYTSQTYDKVVYWATLGKDNYWKKEIIKNIESARSILDLACGTGILTRQLAVKFPKSNIIGIDITESYLKIAEKNSSSFPNISYLYQDAEKLNLEQKFDIICSSYIPKYCEPEIIIKNCISHLKPRGKIIFHDFTYPKNNFIRVLWKSYFVVLNLIGNFISPWKRAFKELPKLIQRSSWLDDYQKEFKKNGFDVYIKNLTWKSSALLIAKHKQEITINSD